MRAFTSKDRAPATRHYVTHTSALPPPYQLAIEDAAFRMTVLENHVPRDYDCERSLAASTWFSVTVTAPPSKRYLYLVQHETETRLVVLLLMFDRSAAGDNVRGLQLPPNGAWLRAIVEGPVVVLASDLVLPRKSITAWLGASEPPSPPQPPYF
jgi:hypothetical protein